MTPRPPNATLDEIAAMLRTGATSRQTAAALHVSPNRVAQARRGQPAPDGRARTVAQTLALHLHPYGDGHALWSGPETDGKPQMWAEGRRSNPRAETFRAHHGRPPTGRITNTCTQRGCLAGPHLADHVIRQARRRLDAQYTAIFGPDAP